MCAGGADVPASVSGVIVDYRTPDLTARAARSLLADPAVQEVVLVDNAGDGSELRSLLAGSPSVRVVASGTNLGFGGGCNLGAEHAHGDLLLFLNSDAVIEPGAVAVLAEALGRHQGVGVVAPDVRRPDGSTQPDSFGSFPDLRTMLSRTNICPDPGELQPDWVTGAAMMLRAADFAAVGGFDPAFHMYFEDVDLCWRLRRRGLRVLRARSAVVVHDGGASGDAGRERTRQYRLSQVRYLRRTRQPTAALAAAMLAAVGR